MQNGAVYLIESEVLEDLKNFSHLNDFSKEVLPHFMEKIATWENKGIHRDIGSLKMLRLAQKDPKPKPLWNKADKWQKKFSDHPIFYKIK